MIKRSVLFVLVFCYFVVTVFFFLGCGATLGPVPNVMGSDHTAAKETLEDAGFEVIEIEADAENILSNTKWKRTVKKGEVFKINDVSCPDYFAQNKVPSVKDGKVRIYYAREEYICEEVDENNS